MLSRNCPLCSSLTTGVRCWKWLHRRRINLEALGVLMQAILVCTPCRSRRGQQMFNAFGGEMNRLRRGNDHTGRQRFIFQPQAQRPLQVVHCFYQHRRRFQLACGATRDLSISMTA